MDFACQGLVQSGSALVLDHAPAEILSCGHRLCTRHAFPAAQLVPLRAHAACLGPRGLVYLGFALQLMLNCDASRIQSRAAHRDDSRIVILLIILVAIAASFAAIAGLIGQAKAPDTTATGKLLLTGLALLTLLTSWGVTQVAFAIHYAHGYYRPDDGTPARGLRFPDCENPDYWDFLYFSTSIGATSQTSDTEIRSRALRRLVTLHAVVAFFFNTAVLALTVNVAASLAG